MGKGIKGKGFVQYTSLTLAASRHRANPAFPFANPLQANHTVSPVGKPDAGPNDEERGRAALPTRLSAALDALLVIGQLCVSTFVVMPTADIYGFAHEDIDSARRAIESALSVQLEERLSRMLVSCGVSIRSLRADTPKFTPIHPLARRSLKSLVSGLRTASICSWHCARVHRSAFTASAWIMFFGAERDHVLTNRRKAIPPPRGCLQRHLRALDCSWQRAYLQPVFKITSIPCLPPIIYIGGIVSALLR
jgi:hypothetical protein